MAATSTTFKTTTAILAITTTQSLGFEKFFFQLHTNKLQLKTKLPRVEVKFLLEVFLILRVTKVFFALHGMDERHKQHSGNVYPTKPGVLVRIRPLETYF